MSTALTNEMRLRKAKTLAPLVTGDEKIAVIGAGGQIGSKLRPVLDNLYPGQVVYFESGPTAEARGFKQLDVTKREDIRAAIKDNNVKVVINLAALLSKKAQENPDLAREINTYAPNSILRVARDEGVRKVQMMSSMAVQEFDPRQHDSEEVRKAKKILQQNAPSSVLSVPTSQYGLSKASIEMSAREFSFHYDQDVCVPRLAGVLNAHTPWPSNGTTEELDKLIVAAAMQKVYGDKWQAKMREAIIKRDEEDGKTVLEKGHYIRDNAYVPEVSADTQFDMVDGKTLAEAAILLLHKDYRAQGGQLGEGKVQHTDPVQNVSEYQVTMEQAADILKQLNPDFKVGFATSYQEGLDMEKMQNAQIWPAKQDTTSTEALIGNFKQMTAEKSITEAYNRAVAALKQQQMDEMDTGVSPKDTGGKSI
ncbi:MAG: NAD-dependent epimerase/dehydratase family protein [Rickettsiales bacterium]